MTIRSRRRFTGIGLALTATLAASPALADLLTYENSRFGTRVTFPAELFDTRMDPPANGDGMAWTSSEGASLSVYAGNNALMVDEAGLLADRTDGHPGIAYSAKGPGWVVVSGIEEGTIFYQRFEFGADDVIHSVLLRYPSSLGTTFDPLVGPIMESLEKP